VFRRDKAAAAKTGASQPPVDVKPGGKGRPTPKRSEAQQQRRTSTRPPKSRKEAIQRAREKAREDRVRSRQALAGGDDRYLPPRDAGPLRRFVRDYVDSRRCAAELFLPIALVLFVTQFLAQKNLKVQSLVTLVFLTVMLLMIVDSVILLRGMKQALRARFPEENLRGLAPYALIRSSQIRRLRMPRPKVKPGGEPA
jgi:hypothetical protein